MRGRFPSYKYLHCQVESVCVCVCVCVCGLKVSRGWSPSLLSGEAFCPRGESRWLFSAPLAHLRRSAPLQNQRFVDMFTKHKQLGLHHIWACSGKKEGGWVYSPCAAVSKRRKLLLVWVRRRSVGLRWHERSWESRSTCCLVPDLWKQQFLSCQHEAKQWRTAGGSQGPGATWHSVT